MCIKNSNVMSIYGIFKKKFDPLEKLGTEPILSNVHPMAIRCPSDVNGPLHFSFCIDCIYVFTHPF